MLLTIEQLLSPEEVAQCRQWLNEANWEDGQRTAGAQARNVKANEQVDDHCPQAGKLRQFILTRLGNDPLFISAALPAKIYPPKFNRYRDSGHYGLHVDSAMMTLPDGNYLRSDISATLFFSDADSYSGGELGIETQYGLQHIKLDAGDMILYPSASLHQVNPVTDGERIASFFWIQSMVRSAFQREQLFELDQSIQQLTIDRGATDNEVRRLSTLYHNLLRAWAEV